MPVPLLAFPVTLFSSFSPGSFLIVRTVKTWKVILGSNETQARRQPWEAGVFLEDFEFWGFRCVSLVEIGTVVYDSSYRCTIICIKLWFRGIEVGDFNKWFTR